MHSDKRATDRKGFFLATPSPHWSVLCFVCDTEPEPELEPLVGGGGGGLSTVVRGGGVSSTAEASARQDQHRVQGGKRTTHTTFSQREAKYSLVGVYTWCDVV